MLAAMDQHTTHPAADILPLLVGEEFEALVLDIRANGLREPIVLHPDGSLLDGRNRERACARAGVSPRYVTWDGQPGTEAAYVISANIRRRHLSVADRAAMAAQISNLKQGRRPNGPSGPFESPAPVSIPEAAKMFEVSERSVKRARAAEREMNEEIPREERRDKRGRRYPSEESQVAKTAKHRERAGYASSMMEALAILATLPAPEDFVTAITPQQRQNFNNQLPVAITWLQRMQEKWNEYNAK